MRCGFLEDVEVCICQPPAAYRSGVSLLEKDEEAVNLVLKHADVAR